MYSFNYLKNYSYSINSDDEEWDEMLVKVFFVTSSFKTKTVSLFKPIRVFQSSFSVKVNMNLSEKTNIKVTDSNGSPVYLRQYKTDSNKEMIISTSSWSYGDYKVTFTNYKNEIIAITEFSIR